MFELRSYKNYINRSLDLSYFGHLQLAHHITEISGSQAPLNNGNQAGLNNYNASDWFAIKLAPARGIDFAEFKIMAVAMHLSTTRVDISGKLIS